MPTVSIVLIFLNGESFLAEAIESVLVQSFSDWELILVDDGSTDRSSTIAKHFADQFPQIRYVEHPGHVNRGMSASRNLGAAQSRGDYLAFLDADDVWQPDKLSEQVDLLEQMPEVALVAGALLYWTSWDPEAQHGDRLVLTGGVADRRLEPPEAALLCYPLGKEAGAGLDGLVRRSAFDAVGGFEEQFRGLYEDQAFLLKLFLRFPVYISSRPWLLYRQHDKSCCALTNRSEHDYRRMRSAFLHWLSDYYDPKGVGGPEVDRAIRRARARLRQTALREHFRGVMQRLRGR